MKLLRCSSFSTGPPVSPPEYLDQAHLGQWLGDASVSTSRPDPMD